MTGKKEEIDVERHSFGGLVLYEVSSDEIEQLEQETLNVGEDLTFATAGLSFGLSFGITLLTVDIPAGRTFTVLTILCLLGFVVALYCGIKWFAGKKSFKRVITKIKSRVGPLGQEGSEISAGLPDGVPQTSKGGTDK